MDQYAVAHRQRVNEHSQLTIRNMCWILSRMHHDNHDSTRGMLRKEKLSQWLKLEEAILELDDYGIDSLAIDGLGKPMQSIRRI